MDILIAKYNLIKKIIGIKSERLITRLLQILQHEAEEEPETAGSPSPLPDEEYDVLIAAKEPIPETIDIEELARKQHYDSHTLAEHFRNLDRSIWEGEDLPELLELLKN